MTDQQLTFLVMFMCALAIGLGGGSILIAFEMDKRIRKIEQEMRFGGKR